MNLANVIDMLAKELGVTAKVSGITKVTEIDCEIREKVMEVLMSFMDGETQQDDYLDYEEEHEDRNSEDAYDDSPEGSPVLLQMCSRRLRKSILTSMLIQVRLSHQTFQTHIRIQTKSVRF